MKLPSDIIISQAYDLPYLLILDNRSQALEQEPRIGHAWAGGLRGDLQNASETMPRAAAGSCTAEDESKMHDFGPGYAEGTFPFVVAYCERKSWSLDGGFYTKEFEACVISHTDLKPSCAACFSKSAVYTYKNCKFACWFHSWCGRECLRCVEESAPEVRQCAGVAVPSVTPC